MSRALSLTLVAAILISSCQFGGDAHPVSGRASAQGGAIVEHASGLTVTIPPGGLYQDDVVDVRQVRPPGDVEPGSFVVPAGTVYEVELESEDAFRVPAEIDIPYDPALLPEGESEAEIFPVFLFDDTWQRAEGGAVDQEANVVRVTTVHNGLWSWGVDTDDNFNDAMNQFFCSASQNAPVVAAAWAEYQQRDAELMAILEDSRIEMEAIEAPTDDVLAIITGAVADKEIEFTLKNIIKIARVKKWGGRDGFIKIAGKRVGVFTGRTLTAYTLLGHAGTAWMGWQEGYAVGSAAGLTVRLYLAYQRWKEAETLVWALENACDVDSMAPQDLEMLNDFYRTLPLDERGHVIFDPLASAYPKTSSVYAIAFREDTQREGEPPPAAVIEGIGDLGTAVDQAMAAAQSNAVLDWFALTDPTLSYDERMAQARDIARRYAPYDLTCLSYQESAVGNFIEGATFIFRAISSSLPDDQLLRFSVGHPPSSEYYRFAPYIHEWQAWDAEYWANVEGQSPPCPQRQGEMTPSSRGQIALLSPVDGTLVPPTEGLVGYFWSLFALETVGAEDALRLAWTPFPGAQRYEVRAVVVDSDGTEHPAGTGGGAGYYGTDCSSDLCSRRFELDTICEQEIVVEALAVNPSTQLERVLAEGRVTVRPIHTDATWEWCEQCTNPQPGWVCPPTELCACSFDQEQPASTSGSPVGEQIWAGGYIYPEAGFSQMSIALVEFPFELVTLLEGPVRADEPDTWWDDIWWRVQYSGGTGWMNHDLELQGIRSYQDGAGLDCRAAGNAIDCVDGHLVAWGACLTDPGSEWCTANP